MPSEIREKILVNLVGDNLIHIKHLCPYELQSAKEVEGRAGEDLVKKGAFRHAVCIASQSELSAYQDAVSGDITVPDGESPEFYIESCQKRHENCKLSRSSLARSQYGLLPREHSSLRIDLSILGVCRQLYEEANHLLWDTNTFSFSEPKSCNKFLASLNPAQKRNFSSLHISTRIEDFDLYWPRRYSTNQGWLTALKFPCIYMLRKVRNLHLCIDQQLTDAVVSANVSAQTPARFRQGMTDNLVGILRLRALNASQVTVVISEDSENMASRLPQDARRWTVAEKLEYAENLRTQLLDPRGGEIAHAADEARKAKDRLKLMNESQSQAERLTARAEQASEREVEYDEEACEAEADAEEASRRLEKAKRKKSGVVDLSSLQATYYTIWDTASAKRGLATRIAADARRWEAMAKDRAEKAERAKARFDGKKPKKKGKVNKKPDENEREKAVDSGESVDEYDGFDSEVMDSS